MKRPVISLLWLFGALVTFSLTACTADRPDSWYPIQKEHRPYVRWWWLGSAVDEEGLTYNLEQFADKGFGGVEITPIYGVQDNEANDVEYLSERWMELLKHTLKEGERLGLGIDMNNGTGWPFGGPTISTDHSARKFILEKIPVAADTLFVGAIRPSDERQQEVAELVRLQAVRGAERIDLTPLVEQDTLRWQPPTGEGWQLYALFMGRTFQKVKRAAPGGEGLVMNHYDRCTLNYYLDRFEEAFDESDTPYPDTFFNDSFEVYGSSWDEKIPDQLRDEWGYDLLDYLPELAGEGDPDRSARIVSDYRETISKLVLNHFTRPWSAWAHRHGAKTRNQAHGSPANLIDLYGAVDIPECESFGRTIFDLPQLRKDTIYKPNDGTPAVLKFASSAAHLTGKKLTSAEALTWLTEHFRTSFAQCKPEIDLMLAAGVNHIVFHGAPYSPKGVEFPGWRFYASINMSPTAALWEDVHPLTHYITRCQSFLAAGKPDNDLLLYLPQYDIWHEQQGNPFLIFDIHKMDRTIPHIKAMMDQLVAAGYDADYLSDRYLRSLSTRRGELISEGDARYRALLIPACHKLPTETLEHLLYLAKKGATLLFLDCYPADVPGFGRLEERDEFRELLAQLPADEEFAEAESFQLGRGRIITGSDFDEMARLAGIRPEPFKREMGGTMLRRKNEVGGYNYFLSMLRNEAVDGWVELATDAKAVMIFDPMTGRTGQAAIRPNEHGTIDVRLQFAPGQSVLLKSFSKPIEQKMWRYAERTAEPIVLNSGWEISFTESVPAVEERFVTDTLTAWTAIDDPRLKINSATGCYTTRFTIEDPREPDEWVLDLGDVRESAVVKLNGERIATLVTIPYRTEIGRWIKEGENLLEVEVKNLHSNRIAEMERQGVRWRIFKDANIASVVGAREFSFGDWAVDPAGLNSEVTLTPIYYEK